MPRGNRYDLLYMALTLIDTNLGADELAVLQAVMQVAISRCTLMRVKTLPATPKTQPMRKRSTSNRVLVIDCETTGRYPYDGDSILEICALDHTEAFPRREVFE